MLEPGEPDTLVRAIDVVDTPAGDSGTAVREVVSMVVVVVVVVVGSGTVVDVTDDVVVGVVVVVESPDTIVVAVIGTAGNVSMPSQGFGRSSEVTYTCPAPRRRASSSISR